MKQILLSIIIPVYNVENYISKCIHSVIRQAHCNMEVILVDDCGRPESINIAEQILSKSSITWRIIHHEYNRGLAAARNSGVAAASGKYIFFLDSDDYLAENCLESLLNKAEESQAEIIFGNYMCVFGDKIIPGNRTRKMDFIAADTAIIGHIRGDYAPMAWNRLILHSWYKTTGVSFIEGILHEDEPWALSLALRCHRIAYINNITYYYQQREGSIMSLSQWSDSRVNGQIEFFRNSYAEIERYIGELPLEFIVWHNTMLWDFITSFIASKSSLVSDKLHELLTYCWSPRLCNISSIPYKDLVIYLLISKLLPPRTAFSIAQLYIRIKTFLTKLNKKMTL